MRRPRSAGAYRQPFSFLLIALLVLQAASALAEPEVYFSPAGGIRDRLLRAINHTKATINLAIFDFTSGELAGALLAAKERGVQIRIVAAARQAQGKHSEIPFLLEKGVKVRLARGNGRGIMHHKFAIFDGKFLVTGSYNWTDSAERFNEEKFPRSRSPGGNPAVPSALRAALQRCRGHVPATSSVNPPEVPPDLRHEALLKGPGQSPGPRSRHWHPTKQKTTLDFLFPIL